MWYAEGLQPADFQDPEYPFVDSIDWGTDPAGLAAKAAAEQTCGDNFFCLYDAFVTGSLEFASVAQSEYDEQVEIQETLSKYYHVSLRALCISHCIHCKFMVNIIVLQLYPLYLKKALLLILGCCFHRGWNCDQFVHIYCHFKQQYGHLESV